jgi:nitroimidazol reductase NimA-like FMN-containing flavoprotein (pyridoxamine 5'-phosphate oxidase superfamily)
VSNLAHGECLVLLQSQQLGRIAYTDESGPIALPVNYVLDGADLLITTTGYGTVARLVTGARVAFEVDGTDLRTGTAWSVVVRGRAHRESPFDPSPRPPEPWSDGARTCTLRITAELITGRRVLAR